MDGIRIIRTDFDAPRIREEHHNGQLEIMSRDAMDDRFGSSVDGGLRGRAFQCNAKRTRGTSYLWL